MSDLLLSLSTSPLARRLVTSAKLPIPMPEKLARPSGPAVERFLEGTTALVAGDGALGSVLAHVLPRAGAKTLVASDALARVFAGPCERPRVCYASSSCPATRSTPSSGAAWCCHRCR